MVNRQDHLGAALKRYSALAFVLWSLLIVSLAVWDRWKIHQFTLQTARNEAQANYAKDVAFREWAASHGGVYVPVDANTPPNIYLSNIPERDITTPSGRKLTLMNPAYMARQVNEYFARTKRFFGHITSLSLKNPINKPDPWEESALKAFEAGVKEVSEVTEMNGKPFLRFMRPIYTKEGCLKCHAEQGYKVGDIRGGVSVSAPLESYYAGQRLENERHAIAYSLIWVIGILGLTLSYRKIRATTESEYKTRAELEWANDQLREEMAQRERVESRLHASELRTLQVVEASPTPMIITDKEQKIVFSNKKFSEMSGYAPNEIADTGQWWGKACPDEEYRTRVLRTWEEAMEKADREMAGMEPVRVSITRKEGSKREVILNYSSIGELGLVVFHDITHLKEREDALEKTTEDLIRSNQELEQFAYVASHDLQEPLRTIASYLQILASNYKGKLDAEADSFINFAVDGARRLQAVIQDLLAYSRLSAHFNPRDNVDPAECAGNALISLREMMERTGAAIKLGAMPKVKADPDQLSIVFHNLIANAITYTDSSVKPEVEIKAVEREGLIELSIKDNGVGIETQYHELIFKMFQRLRPAKDRIGTGVGLAMCKKIVEMGGGNIWVESTPGEGSVFRFTIKKAEQ